MKQEQDMDEYVYFHGMLGSYVADCYSDETQKALNKMKATTYTVTIGNCTVHYFSNELPKKKDFNLEWNSYAKNKEEKFWKELRIFIKSNKLFIKNAVKSQKINILKKKVI